MSAIRQETKKKLFTACFFTAVLALTVWAVFRDANPVVLWECLSGIRLWFLIPMVACVLLFILGESVIIYYLMRGLHTEVKLSHCCFYSFIGFFYSAITPSASGGQPMQVIAMRRDGIPTASSTVVLAIVTMAYKLVLVLIGCTVVLLRPRKLMFLLDDIMAIVYLGLFLNVVFIALLFCAVFFPAVVRRGADMVLRLCRRFPNARRLEGLPARVERLVEQYRGAAEFFKAHPFLILNVFVITLLQRLCYFFVAFLTYKAFDLAGTPAVSLTLLYAMISVAVDMLPLPGGMGISEKLFLTIFQPVFGEPLVLPAMIVTRGICYYTQLVISAVMTGLSRFVLGCRRSNAQSEDRQ